ncbi:hypothetical protein BQ8794_30541 [Mesorhizobium prunaredense]|uniref:Uncharacterized protein n=1 Tax=Mesorhizobium prunaredense TaxID=1631249 RepID=A0A1R3VE38_9HYPH|nr:hypothetical protein BQ8794_30541 [Mesorhizobium prunaredense]
MERSNSGLDLSQSGFFQNSKNPAFGSLKGPFKRALALRCSILGCRLRVHKGLDLLERSI